MEPSVEPTTTMRRAASPCNVPVDETKSSRKMKPYGCMMCKRAFSKALNLQKHMMETHGVTEESDDDDDDEVVDEDKGDASHAQNQDGDRINVLADAAASVLGESCRIAGEDRDTDDPHSCFNPRDGTQGNPWVDTHKTAPNSGRGGTSSTGQVQTALLMNPGDIIAQAAVGAKIIVDAKKVHGLEIKHSGREELSSAEDVASSCDHNHVEVARDDESVFFRENAAGVVRTDGKEQCNETISQVPPVLLHIDTPSSKIATPEPRKSPPAKTAGASKATGTCQEDCICIDGDGPNEKLKKEQITKAKSSTNRCRKTSHTKCSFMNKVSSAAEPRPRSGELEGNSQDAGHANLQNIQGVQRPSLRRSRRCSKKRVDSDFIRDGEGKTEKMIRSKRMDQRKVEKKRKRVERKGEKKEERKQEITEEDLPQSPQECTAKGTNRKRKTLEEKLAELHRAHEETMKLNAFVQNIITDGSDAKLASNQKSSTSRKRKCNKSKTYDCLSCQKKFHVFSECIDHMKKAHLPSKKRCPNESEGEPTSLDVSPTLEVEEDSGVEEVLVPHQENSAPKSESNTRKVPKILQKRKSSGTVGEVACDYCSEVSKTFEGHRLHMKSHCGLVEEKCHKCKVYEPRPSAAQIEAIEKSVEKGRELTESSGYEFRHGRQLVEQFLQCIVCGSCFAVYKHLRNHMSQHKAFVCQVCSSVFPSTEALGKHIPHHKTGPLTCKTCGQTFFSSKTLLAHIRSHSNKFRCNDCGATFRNRGNLLKHQKQSQAHGHGGGVRFITKSKYDGKSKVMCTFCENLFCSETTLRRHIEAFHPEKVDDRGKYMYVCEICGAVKHNHKTLQAHMICHNKPKQKCHMCDKVFLQPTNLKGHIQRVHEQRREFTCQYCGKCVSSNMSLQDHERLHTGEKPYKCVKCGESFRLRRSYQSHLQSKHLKDRSFRCDQCGKGFFTHHALYKHKRIHTPNVWSVCPECGKQFKRKDLLQYHVVQYHRGHLRCSKCTRRFNSEISLRYHMNKKHKINLYLNHNAEQDDSESQSQTSPAVKDIPSPTVRSENLSTAQAIPSQSDTPEDPSYISHSSAKNIISATLIDTNSKDSFTDVSLGSSVGLPSTSVTLETSHALPRPYATDQRLSDPTNVAISTIFSQLFERNIGSVSE
ncbi:zinc finger protein 227-like [Lytechinus pictus]|uniref:zinc finger protein 227-like n=1 Tax=Lytechinus pictus TaxID=7653 RepID=UPI0030B9C5BC